MFNILQFHIVSSALKNTKIVAFIVISLLLSACGSGGGTSEPTTSSASSNVNNDDSETPEEVAAIVISSQPATITVDEGGEAVFTVVATGGGELSYQWRKGEDNISGANSSSLTLSNVELSSVDEYSVVVTNLQGAVSSLSALLNVNALQASVELSWDIPVEREDGSELSLYEINGYVVKYGTNSDSLDSLVNIDGYSDTNILIEELSPGTYYFAIATIDSDGVQGAYSTQLEQIVL